MRSAVVWCLLALVGLLCAPTAPAAEDVWRWRDVDRVVVFGDVHGDHDALISLLRSAEIIDADGVWSAGATHLVSLGDLLDRGPDSRRVMDLLMRLQQEAVGAGGRVHLVLGNHEVMNLTGDLRYVAPEEYAAFAGADDDALRALALTRAMDAGLAPELVEELVEERPPGFFAHRQAFSASGHYGRWLLDQRALVVINDRAYMHGGASPALLQVPLDDLESGLRQTLVQIVEAGEDPVYGRADMLGRDLMELGVVAIEPGAEAPPGLADLAARLVPLTSNALLGPDGPFWYRGNASCHALLEGPALARTLDGLGVQGVAVGHTPQRDGRIHSRFDDRVLLADTGMLARYYGGTPRALVIEQGTLSVVSPAQDQAVPEPERNAVDAGLAAADMDRLLASGAISAIPGEDDDRVRVSLDGDAVIARVLRAGERDRRHMIAARRLDRLMDLGMVPAIAERKIDGRTVLIEAADGRWIGEAERASRGMGVPDFCYQGHVFDLVRLFDLLIGNRRTTEGLSYRSGDLALRLTQHGDAFTRERRIDPAITLPSVLHGAVAALTPEQLRSALADLLDARRLDALLTRRALLVERTGEP